MSLFKLHKSFNKTFKSSLLVFFSHYFKILIYRLKYSIVYTFDMIGLTKHPSLAYK